MKDYITEYFFGMSPEKQIEVIGEIFNSKKEIDKYIYDEFYRAFDYYHFIVEDMIKNKERFYKLNSKQRRYLRYEIFNTLYIIIDSHRHVGVSDKAIHHQIKYHSFKYGFLDSSEAIENHLINPIDVSDEEVDVELEAFKNLNKEDKTDYVEELVWIYGEHNICDYPFTKKIINDYNEIVKTIIGEDLYPIYNEKIYTSEKIWILTKISDTINDIYDGYCKTFTESDAVRNKKIKVKNCIEEVKKYGYL